MPDDLSKLCVHTITTKPWDIETAIEKYSAAGVRGITVWRNWLKGKEIRTVRQNIKDSGLELENIDHINTHLSA